MTMLISMILMLLMLGSLALVPFGLPGLWLMVLVLAVGLAMGSVSWTLWLALVGVAGVSEVAEFFLLKKVGDRYGASRKAFWGAIVGGLVGVLIGVPVPVIGSLLAGLIGTFVGGGLVTLLETRSLGDASRVGAGVVLARTMAVGLKVGAGVLILVLGGLGLILR